MFVYDLLAVALIWLGIGSMGAPPFLGHLLFIKKYLAGQSLKGLL